MIHLNTNYTWSHWRPVARRPQTICRGHIRMRRGSQSVAPPVAFGWPSDWWGDSTRPRWTRRGPTRPKKWSTKGTWSMHWVSGTRTLSLFVCVCVCWMKTETTLTHTHTHSLAHLLQAKAVERNTNKFRGCWLNGTKGERKRKKLGDPLTSTNAKPLVMGLT